ncbi:MAG: AMP phosphorylase [Candidatus Nanoarchaeia archaeon]
MRLKAKLLNIESGGPLIVVLNPTTIKEMDLGPADRVRIMAEKHYAVAIADSSTHIEENEIGLFDEVKDLLNISDGQPLTVIAEEKPFSISSIRKKLEGAKLTKDEIFELVTDIVDNRLTQAEIATFITATYTKGMDLDETEHLTRAMAETGQILRLGIKPVIDIHSIGGVPGNRTTLIVVPIVAAAGLCIPKTASRAITDPAGTADVMEVLAPVSLKLEEIKNIVLHHKGCIAWGGALDIAPADDIIIEVEHPLQLDPTAMLLASILAKKYAIGTTDLLMEIPFGPGTKCTKPKANELEKKFMILGGRLGINVKVIKTNGSQPVGNGIGPVLECKDVLQVLENSKSCPNDLKNKSLFFAGLLLEMGKVAKRGSGLKMAKEILESGKALDKFKEIIKAQKGNPTITSDTLMAGKYDETITAEKSGIIQAIDNDIVKKIGRRLGAPYNKGAGLYLHLKVGDKVKEGDKLFTLYAESGRKLSEGLSFVETNNPYKIKII